MSTSRSPRSPRSPRAGSPPPNHFSNYGSKPSASMDSIFSLLNTIQAPFSSSPPSSPTFFLPTSPRIAHVAPGSPEQRVFEALSPSPWGGKKGQLSIFGTATNLEVSFPSFADVDAQEGARVATEMVLMNLASDWEDTVGGADVGCEVQIVVEKAYEELEENRLVELARVLLATALHIPLRLQEGPGVNKVFRTLPHFEGLLEEAWGRAEPEEAVSEMAVVVCKVSLFLSALLSFPHSLPLLASPPCQRQLDRYESDLLSILNTNSPKHAETIRPFIVPFPRNPRIRGREWLLRKIHGELMPPGNEGQGNTSPKQAQETQELVPRIVVLQAPEGHGKSQVALEYAYRHREEYWGVVWVDCGAWSSGGGMEEVREALQLRRVWATEGAKLREGVVQRMEAGDRILLVLNGVLSSHHLKLLMPQGGHCQCIITTANMDLRVTGPGVHSHRWRGISKEASLQILTSHGTFPRHDYPVVDEIGREIQQYPLALDCAARLLGEGGVGPSPLLVSLQAGVTALFKQPELDLTFRKNSSVRRLLEVVCKTLQSSASSSPAAALAMALFRVAGWFGPQPIPVNLLVMAAQTLRGSKVSANEGDLDAALVLLHQLNLGQPLRPSSTKPPRFTFHPVLGAFSRTLPDSRPALTAVVQVLSGALCCQDLVGHFAAAWKEGKQEARGGEWAGGKEAVLGVGLDLTRFLVVAGGGGRGWGGGWGWGWAKAGAGNHRGGGEAGGGEGMEEEGRVQVSGA